MYLILLSTANYCDPSFLTWHKSAYIYTCMYLIPFQHSLSTKLLARKSQNRGKASFVAFLSVYISFHFLGKFNRGRLIHTSTSLWFEFFQQASGSGQLGANPICYKVSRCCCQVVVEQGIKGTSSLLADMDYSSSGVDTSLDLNINYHRVCDDSSMMRDRLGMAREVQSKFIELGRKVSEKEETGALVKELNRLSEENKKLTEMLNAVSESYHALRGQMMDYMRKASREKEISVGQTKKRKSESSNNVGVHGNSESSSTDEGSSKKPREEVIKAKVSRIRVRTEASDTSLVVKDGYQWRKYGQKVTRDNPCPRAYFKCSFAPSCPVKKKVQRSIEDQSILVATYEGEHNHQHTSQMEATPAGSGRNLTFGSVPCSASLGSSGPTITLDLTKSKPSNLPDVKSPKPAMDAPEVKQFLVEQMASSLRKDPNFTAALAAAISGRMLQQNHTGKW